MESCAYVCGRPELQLEKLVADQKQPELARSIGDALASQLGLGRQQIDERKIERTINHDNGQALTGIRTIGSADGKTLRDISRRGKRLAHGFLLGP